MKQLNHTTLVLVVTLIAVYSTLPGCFNPHNVDGDILYAQSDSAAFFFQNVTIVFPNVSVTRTGVHEFEWKGTPAQEMFLILSVADDAPDLDAAAVEAIHQADAEIRIQLFDRDNRLLVERVGRIREWRLKFPPIRWKAPPERFEYHFGAMAMNHTFRLRIEVQVENEDQGDYELHPMLLTSRWFSL